MRIRLLLLQLVCQASQDALGGAVVASAKQVVMVEIMVQEVKLLPVLMTCRYILPGSREVLRDTLSSGYNAGMHTTTTVPFQPPN